ncbi:RNA methyltransferase [Georgenia sp. 10Sc9-8]|uniref:RNA methyltransferase n=1 Tax=Georgenia halotolerans TaxID=3028317 RepID=A0ABT5U0M7_9MICO|nr:RNA methyltransferase [Georgenia halotolerans]
MHERLAGPDLTNPRAERVRRVRALARRSSRLRHGQFLVEGPQGVREAVRHCPGQVRDVYLTPAAAERHPEVVAAARAAQVYLHTALPEVLAAMSPDAQGVLAVLDATSTRLSEVLSAGPRLVVLLAGVSDPGNAGTVIRAADAAGADAVVLAAGSVELLNPKVVRSTAGSLFHLPVVTGALLEEVLPAVREAGLQILAADGAGEWDLDELDEAAARGRLPAGGHRRLGPPAAGTPAPDLAAPTAWVLGNEAHGLTGAARGTADAVVRVPIHGLAESLNLATAATVCLYASARAQRRG